MRIVQVEIHNFRGIQSATIQIPKHGVFFGANNAGKTSIIEALALTLGREQMAPVLSDWDFTGGEPKPESRIEIVVTIGDFGESSALTAYPEWFCGEHSARPVWWNDSQRVLSYEADCPANHMIAAQVALCVRYDDEVCEFDCIRYFYDGPNDPFLTDVRRVPNARLQELGVFVLSANRQWDRLLTLGSSSFLKVLRAGAAIPASAINAVKEELRNPINRIEKDPSLEKILRSAEKELSMFLMLDSAGKLVYRPTMLDVKAVMQSLTPHVSQGDFILPFSKHGAGMNSLQSFLILLAFAEQRDKQGKNFILIAEEPELHLHPALHARLANRIRSLSTQSIVTTHSPLLAASYKPNEAIFVRTERGVLHSKMLREEPISQIPKNSIKNLYLKKRVETYDALMGSAILVPEGEFDRRWIALWQRIVESSESPSVNGPLTVLPTQDAEIVDTFSEIAKFRPDALPMMDGDPAGNLYRQRLIALSSPPRILVQLGSNAAIESLSAWILEPCLSKPGPQVTALLAGTPPTLKGLIRAIAANKKDFEIQENLAWEAADVPESVARAREFLEDLYRIAVGEDPVSNGWTKDVEQNTTTYKATHIVNP